MLVDAIRKWKQASEMCPVVVAVRQCLFSFQCVSLGLFGYLEQALIVKLVSVAYVIDFETSCG